MMLMRRWEPFRGWMNLGRAMERMWDEPLSRTSRLWSWAERTMDVDVYQTEDALVVKAALPGIKPEEVDITLSGDILTIHGKVREESESKREDYLLRERHFGSFNRTLRLPSGLDTDKAEAGFTEGVLTLTIPKVEEAKPKSVKVKVGK